MRCLPFKRLAHLPKNFEHCEDCFWNFWSLVQLTVNKHGALKNDEVLKIFRYEEQKTINFRKLWWNSFVRDNNYFVFTMNKFGRGYNSHCEIQLAYMVIEVLCKMKIGESNI